MSDIVKYRVVSFKKYYIVALYFTMSDIVHREAELRAETVRKKYSVSFCKVKSGDYICMAGISDTFIAS